MFPRRGLQPGLTKSLHTFLYIYYWMDERSTLVKDVRSDVIRVLLEVSKRLSKERKGAFFVVGDEAKLEGCYQLHYPQLAFKGDLLSRGMDAVVERLATLDGAMIISPNGEIIAYGARILKSRAILGFGTKHAAAKGITEYDPDITAIVVSEETGWIKVFQKGNIILETDSVDIEPSVLDKVASFLTNQDTALLVGAGISAATLGMAPTAVLIIGGWYLVVKNAFTMISAAIKKEKNHEK